MSTRANIGIKLDNGQYKMIYSHFDGYPRHVGEVLANYHNSYEKALELLEGNVIRCFKTDGSFERYNDGQAHCYDSIEDALDGFDYVYIFTDKWHCYTSAMFGLKEYRLYV